MSTVKFGLSTAFDCGYLPDNKERLLVYIDETPMSTHIYNSLQSHGFRRSESYVYRPHCQQCDKCRSIRLPVQSFTPSKSQKRVLTKAKHFQVNYASKVKSNYYPLFEQYVNTKHLGGVMYPADENQLNSFVKCEWAEQLYIELYDDTELIAVAICDVTIDSVSAVYTFYNTDYQRYSIGTLMILQQLHLAKSLHKTWVYLGYYIEDCQKMNYKTRFKPYQIRQGNEWITYK